MAYSWDECRIAATEYYKVADHLADGLAKMTEYDTRDTIATLSPNRESGEFQPDAVVAFMEIVQTTGGNVSVINGALTIWQDATDADKLRRLITAKTSSLYYSDEAKAERAQNNG